MRHALPRKQTMAKRIRELEVEVKKWDKDAQEWAEAMARERARADSAEEALKVYQEAESVWRARAEKAEELRRREALTEQKERRKAEVRVAVAEAALKREGFVYCNCDQSGPLWYRPRDEPFKHPFTDYEAGEREEG